MDEYGAATAGYARPPVVIDLDHEVVKAIGAAKPIAWLNGRAAERPVIAPVGWILAPGVGSADAARRKQRVGMRQAVGSPPEPKWMKYPVWRAAITFTLIGLNSGPAERDWHGQRACKQPALRSPAGP